MPPSGPPPPPMNGPLVDLRPTYGAIVIGVMFSIGLIGILTAQVWRYYNNFPKDPKYLKLIVAYVWLVEILRSSFSVHGVYYYLVLEWGNPLALSNLVWSSQITLLMSPLIEVVVRFYFAYRVWIISRQNLIVTPFICLLALANFSIGVGTWGFSQTDTKVTDHTDLLRNFGTAGLALSIATDWSISLSLIFFLNKNRSGMSRTNDIINRIVFYTVNLGLITSVTDIVILVLSLWNSATPQLYFLAIFQVIGNLYANSLMASLNSRAAMREKDPNVALSDFSTFEAGSGPQAGSTTAGSIPRSGEPVSLTTKNSSRTNIEEKKWDSSYAV